MKAFRKKSNFIEEAVQDIVKQRALHKQMDEVVLILWSGDLFGEDKKV